MLKHNSSTFVNDYLTWFANGIVAKQVGEVLELTLPFLDRHRDQLQIYLQAQEERYVQHNLIQAVLALNGWGTSLYNKKLSQT